MSQNLSIEHVSDESLLHRCLSFKRHGADMCDTPKDGIQILSSEESKAHVPGVYKVLCPAGCRFSISANQTGVRLNINGEQVDANDKLVAR